MTYAQRAYDVFTQIKVLVKDKGMSLEDAVDEIEKKLHTKLPDQIIDKAREELKC